jgi:hypothetical protein
VGQERGKSMRGYLDGRGNGCRGGDVGDLVLETGQHVIELHRDRARRSGRRKKAQKTGRGGSKASTLT